MATPIVRPNSFPGATRLSTDRYHTMVDRGIIESGAPIELLDGFLVLKDRSKKGEDPISIGAPHAATVDRLTELAADVKALGAKLRIQQSLTLPPDDEPEPDAAIVMDSPLNYRQAHPTAGQVHCVIEVADSSLEHDGTTKQKIYAVAGIPQFVLINLVDSVVEVYTQPDAKAGKYQNVDPIEGNQNVDLSCGENCVSVSIAELLNL